LCAFKRECAEKAVYLSNPILQDIPGQHKTHNTRGTPSRLQNKKERGWGCVIAMLAVFLAVAWAAWRILPYMPFYPQRIILKSAEFLRSPHVYTRSDIEFNPAQPPLEPEWNRLSVDRENALAVFESTGGESIRATLGKSYWVSGCENQFQIEVFPLTRKISLGLLTLQQPVLVVVCDMWGASDKLRPERVVLMERPIPGSNPFFLGVQCNSGAPCLAFAESLGELVVTVFDSETGEPLPDARITLSNGMGIQEFDGGFRLPVYVSLQTAYQILLPGYEDRVGEIFNYFGNKMDIMYFTNAEHTRGSGDTLELPGNGQQVEYVIKLVKK
jgi:hypothetical protein